MAALFEQQFAGRELWAGYEIENEGSQRYLIVPSRLALRPDLYETLKGFGVPSLSAADIADHANKSIYSQYACHPISGDSEFNRYLGFIELRMHSVQAPIALAVLAVPRQLRHAQNVTVMTGTYGPIFGGPGFSSTVYSMQDQGGGKCAQGCAIMVLGMLSDRGASVLGSLSVTYLASDPHDIRRVHSDSKSQVRSPKGCLKKKNHQKVMSVEGLNFNELNRLFQSSECGTTVSGYRFESNEQRLAIRVVESYVTARMPPIILVQDRAWEKSDDISVAEDKLLDGDSDFVGHAVVVVGFRKFKKDKKSQLSGSPTLPDSLIVHDPGYSPYFERSSRHVFGAGLGFEHRAGQEHRNKFHAIFAAPKTIKTHLLNCLGELLQSEDGSDVANWEWFVAEAPNANDLTQQAASDQRDFQFSHIHKEDVGELLFSDTQSRDAAHERAEKDDWRQAVDKIQGSWCWVVRCFENKCLRIAWIFEANVDIKNQWRDWSQFLVPWAARVVANDLEASHADSSNDRFTFEHSIRRQDDQPARAIDIETLNQPFVGKEGLKHKNRLRASVISSSSERRLTDFIREVRQVSRVRDFDI